MGILTRLMCLWSQPAELQFLAGMHWLHFSGLEVAAHGWISLYASDSTSYPHCAASLRYGWWWIWKKVRGKWPVCQLASAFASNNQSPPLSSAQGMSFSPQITKVKRPPWHSTALQPSLHTTRIHHVLGFVFWTCSPPTEMDNFSPPIFPASPVGPCSLQTRCVLRNVLVKFPRMCHTVRVAFVLKVASNDFKKC